MPSKRGKTSDGSQEADADNAGLDTQANSEGNAKRAKRRKSRTENEPEIQDSVKQNGGASATNGALSDGEEENTRTGEKDVTRRRRKRSKKGAGPTEPTEKKAAVDPSAKKKERRQRYLEGRLGLGVGGSVVEETVGREVKVHVSRFVEYQPQSITAMAFDPRGSRLAVARGNGDIQLWSTVAPRWHPIAMLAGSVHRKIRALAWAPPPSEQRRDDDEEEGEGVGAAGNEGEGGEMRLLSGSLDGTITSWSMSTLSPESVTDSHGGSIWSMAVSGKGDVLAVACHDGGVRLFDLGEGDVTFKKGLPPHPGQSLSVAWAGSGKVLVSGDSEGAVRVWGLSTSPPSCIKVSVRAPSAGNERDRSAPLVWSVCVLPDQTVFASDSKGRTHVIDGTMGVAVKSFVGHHGADTLSLVNDGFEVFSAGVDGRVVHYRRGKLPGPGPAQYEWAMVGAARYHTHDVLCLCLAGQYNASGSRERIAGRHVPSTDPTHHRERVAPSLNEKRTLPCVVSGGLDTQLCLYTYEQSAGRKTARPGDVLTQAIRLPAWPHESCVAVSGLVEPEEGGGEGARREVRMVSWQSHSLDLWRWTLDASESGAVSVDGEPRYALRVNTQADENLACAAISPDGRWLAFSHPSRLSVYHLSLDPSDRSLDVTKCELPVPLAVMGANALAFLSDSRRLAIAEQSGEVLVVELESFQVQASYKPSELEEFQSTGSSPAINRIAVSPDGQWLATCDIEGHVHLLSPETSRLHTALPALPAKVTALRFAPSESLSQQVLVIVTAENRVYLFDVEASRLSAFPPPDAPSHSYSALLSYAHHCYGISFNPSVPGSLMLWGHSFLCHLDLNPPQPDSEGTGGSKKRNAWDSGDGSVRAAGFKMIHKYSPLLAVDFIAGDNLLLVERPWLQVLSQIGGTMYRKRFGK